VTHEGPHFLHMDYLDYERNLKLFSHFVDCLLHAPDLSHDYAQRQAVELSWHAWCQQEAVRLKELAANLRREGLETVPPYSLLSPNDPDKHMWIHGYKQLMEDRVKGILGSEQCREKLYASLQNEGDGK